MVLRNAILVLLTVHISISTAIWQMTTKPVVFGQNVTLKCNVPNNPCMACDEAYPCQWTGGKSYQLLAMNGISIHPSKYQMTTNKTSGSFYLTILNFREADLDHEYTCTCGFEDYTEKLTIKKDDILLLPTPESTHDSSMFTDERLLINITLEKVYPVPDCFVRFGGEIIINNINYSLHEYKWFYEAEFQQLLHKKTCQEPLETICNVSSNTLTVSEKYLCEDLDDINLNLPVLWIVVSSTVFIAISLVFFIYIKNRGVDRYEPAPH